MQPISSINLIVETQNKESNSLLVESQPKMTLFKSLEMTKPNKIFFQTLHHMSEIYSEFEELNNQLPKGIVCMIRDYSSLLTLIPEILIKMTKKDLKPDATDYYLLINACISNHHQPKCAHVSDTLWNGISDPAKLLAEMDNVNLNWKDGGLICMMSRSIHNNYAAWDEERYKECLQNFSPGKKTKKSDNTFECQSCTD